MLTTHPDMSLHNPTQELELETCSVLIYTHLSLIQVLWNDTVSQQDYRANILQVLQIATKLNIKYLLSDAHQLKFVDNNEWFLQVCVPLLIKSRVKKVARIVPYNPTAITHNQKLVDVKHMQALTHRLAFDFEVFTDIDAAFHWLEIRQPYLVGQS